MSPTQVTAAFWEALYQRDWDDVATFFGPESIYFDVPTGPSTAARGPVDVVRRLRLGLDGLSGYEHSGEPLLVADGEVVITEHTEVWHWHTGESVALPFVSVQRVRDGVILVWKDYWDYQTLLGASPAWWQERLFSDDLSWVHDATGHPLV